MSNTNNNGIARKKIRRPTTNNKGGAYKDLSKEQFRSTKDSREYRNGRAGPEQAAKRKTARKRAYKSASQERFKTSAEAGGTDTNSTKESRESNEEFFRCHDTKEEKEDGYTSGREEARSRRTHRQYQSGERINRLKKKAEKAAERTEKAKRLLPQRKEYKLVRRFDEKTGRGIYKLEVRESSKRAQRRNVFFVAGERIAMEGNSRFHQKISEYEKDNSGVEAAHKTEQALENIAWRIVQSDWRSFFEKRVSVLERKQFKAEANFQYKKFLEDNPKIRKNIFQKRVQKQRIKREYAKSMKKGAEAKQAAGFTPKVAQSATSAVRKINGAGANNILMTKTSHTEKVC